MGRPSDTGPVLDPRPGRTCGDAPVGVYRSPEGVRVGPGLRGRREVRGGDVSHCDFDLGKDLSFR